MLTYPSQIHKGLIAGLIRGKEIVPKPDHKVLFLGGVG